MASNPTTYTTIPISGTDVISRSIANLKSTFSQHRPWSELFAAGTLNLPESLSTAISRLRKNTLYFRLNYLIFLVIFTLFCLIQTPLYLILISANLAAWLVLYFSREDPLVVMNLQLSDKLVLFGLVLVTLVDLWLTGVAGNLVVGAGIGFLIVAIHGAFRNPDGLFFDEQEAVSAGLIGARGYGSV